MTRLILRYFFVLLIIISFQSCGTCSHHHVGKDGGEAPVVNRGREVWSTLSDVGYPIIPDSIASRVLERYCYTASHNKNTRQPNWVMWQLTGDHVMNRKEGVWNEYREDVDLPVDERTTLADYASSGYDRGHMCPGGDCNWDDVGRDETFVLSNMCPQNPQLNRGDWKEIEMACRKWAQKYGNIYIYSMDKDGCYTIRGKSIGITSSTTSFYNSDADDGNGAWAIGAIIDPKDNSGKGFLDKMVSWNVTLDDYIDKARNGHPYDFKVTNGGEIVRSKEQTYMYRGMGIGKTASGRTIYTSARDIGNIAAGIVAAKNWIPWNSARLAFDAYQSRNGLQVEGLSTRNAEYYGWSQMYSHSSGITEATHLRNAIYNVFEKIWNKIF